MKQTISNQSIITFVSLFITFTALSLTTLISNSYAEVIYSESLCQTSQRGIRCGTMDSSENASFTTLEIDQYLAHVEEFCSNTTRGTRCINKSDDLTLMEIDTYQPTLQKKSSCTASVRGTRCEITHS